MWSGTVVALLAVLACACACGGADTAAGCGDVTADAGPPLLLEQRMEEATGPFLRRLSPDGTYAEYSGTQSTFRGGAIVTERVEPAWRVREQLSAEQVARVEAALRHGFFDLDDEYRPPGTTVDGFRVTWRACSGGREHAVVLHSVDAGQVPALAAVRDAFELALAEAADEAGRRERGD